MNTTLMGAAAHGLGSLRMGRRAVPGQGRLVDGLGKLACWVGGDRAVVSPWPGVRFETDLTDRIQRQMWAGVYEPHVRECFNAILEPGAVYFDVGAHIGFHAVFAAHRVGQQGRVFAFEADPRVYERLARNLSQFRWAQAVNAAVWERTGSLTFERSSTKEESGWGTVSAVRDFGKGEHVEIPSIALDDWCRDLRLERWDAMKLDAEGSELAVLRGAQVSLQNTSPVAGPGDQYRSPRAGRNFIDAAWRIFCWSGTIAFSGLNFAGWNPGTAPSTWIFAMRCACRANARTKF